MGHDIREGRVPDLLSDLERELKTMVPANMRLADIPRIKKKVMELLESTKASLEMRGYEATILPSLEGRSHDFPVLQIKATDSSTQDLISRNMKLLNRDANSNPTVIYDPFSTVTGRDRGTWNPQRQIMTLNLNSLFDTQHLPSTLIHERLHLEVGAAIARRSQGALKPYYGHLSGKMAGESSYAGKGFLSVDETKAWITNVRARELDLARSLEKSRGNAQIMKIQKDGLLGLYEGYTRISGDVIKNLESVEKQLETAFFKRTSFEYRSWHGTQEVYSARVLATTPDGNEFVYTVPLVEFAEKPSKKRSSPSTPRASKTIPRRGPQTPRTCEKSTHRGSESPG